MRLPYQYQPPSDLNDLIRPGYYLMSPRSIERFEQLEDGAKKVWILSVIHEMKKSFPPMIRKVEETFTRTWSNENVIRKLFDRELNGNIFDDRFRVLRSYRIYLTMFEERFKQLVQDLELELELERLSIIGIL